MQTNVRSPNREDALMREIISNKHWFDILFEVFNVIFYRQVHRRNVPLYYWYSVHSKISTRWPFVLPHLQNLLLKKAAVWSPGEALCRHCTMVTRSVHAHCWLRVFSFGVKLILRSYLSSYSSLFLCFQFVWKKICFHSKDDHSPAVGSRLKKRTKYVLLYP